jgi:glycosyltransferase involved in cell wall biosynthesis
VWHPPRQEKSFFIPVGANCPEPHAAGRQVRVGVDGAKTVAVYSVTGGAETVREIADIGFSMKRGLRAAGPLNLVVFGRGSQEAESALRAEFAGTGLNVETLGLLSPEDVTQVLARADVLLFVRGSISSRRGSAIAGIACGLPIVCYAGTETAWPITEAGVLGVPQGDREALSEALERVLTDDALRASLGERSRRAQAQYFCWSAIASRYADALCRPSGTRGEDLSMRSGAVVHMA